MTTTLITTITISSPTLVQSVFADHGQEIVLTSKDASFAPVSSGEGGNQVKVVVNYAVHNPMIANDLVKGVMKVYSPDGTLLKTSSSPTPFPISNSYGTATLATTLTDPTIESVTAKIVFTNPIKTETISNELLVKIDLVKGITPASPDEKQIETQAVQDEKRVVTPPIPAGNEEVTEQPTVVQPQEEQQPITPTGPLFPGAPQTFTSESATTSQLSQKEQLTASAASVEVCDDTLDNDLDAKIDSEDEECISTAHLNQQLESNSQEGQESENSNNEEQPQSDERDEDDEDNEDEDDNNED